jgi:small nuclear ribonucleoprotein (snRNP)-like protein
VEWRVSVSARERRAERRGSTLLPRPITFRSHALSLPLPFIQVELTSGETYRGDLAETEDNWNVQLKNVTATAKVNWRGRGTGDGGRRRVFFFNPLLLSLSLNSHSPALSPPLPLTQDGKVSHMEHVFVRGARIK